VVGKFVEFYGPGLANLSVEDQATIGNMSPEYGATCGFFPVSAPTLKYLKDTGRASALIALVEAYAKAQGMFRTRATPDPVFTDSLELDLGSVVSSFDGARRVAEAVQVAVRGATSLSCSLGVSTSKVVCKVASDRRKPGGITVVPPGREARFLAPLPSCILPGVGPRSEERLAAAGVLTIGALAELGDDALRAVLPGQVGRLLRDRARGVDPRDLDLESERISISTEETFDRDLTDRAALHGELRRMAAEVASYLERDGLSARTVTTKLRYSDFMLRSRSATLPTPIDEPERIADLACTLLDRGLRDRPGALRLVGVGVSGLTTVRQLTLEEL
jgi:DNA polymerase-4